jgi:hypothetical protein
MEMIGELGVGFTCEELKAAGERYRAEGRVAEWVNLVDLLPPSSESVEEAGILIVRSGAVDADAQFAELKSLMWDTRAFMRGAVKNKRARYNVCFAEFSRDPDYETGRGTVVDFAETPALSAQRAEFAAKFGKKAARLFAEGNLYYDVERCGIGYHGDAERRRVIAVRYGEPMSFHYQWFHQSQPIGENFRVMLNHGDAYAMSAKAVGPDWKRRKVPTLRHAAGCAKYTTPPGSKRLGQHGQVVLGNLVHSASEPDSR